MDTLIFISGSQRLGHREIAQATKALIDARPGFRAFFAAESQDPGGTTEVIFRALQTCSGWVGFLHNRGAVHEEDRPVVARSSVWVNQELAVIAYRRHHGDNIPTLLFRDTDIEWYEGVLAYTMFNPKPLGHVHEVLGLTEHWLSTSDFSAVSASVEAFTRLWSKLDLATKQILKGIIDLGGEHVGVGVPALRGQVMKYFKDPSVTAQKIWKAQSVLTDNGFVLLDPPNSALATMKVNSVWCYFIRRCLVEESIMEPSLAFRARDGGVFWQAP